MKSSGIFSLAAAVSVVLASSGFAADAPSAPIPDAAPPSPLPTTEPLNVPAPPAPPMPVAPPPSKPLFLKDPVAVVEGQEIKKAEVEAAFSSMLAAQGVPASQVPEDQRAQGYRMIVDDLIIQKLVSKRAAEIKVTDAEVAAQLEQIKGRVGSEEELKKQVEKSGQTMEKLKGNLREHLQQEHWLEAQIGDKAAVSDADLAEFYKKNPEQFKRPEQVRASHVLISIPEGAKPEVVAEKQKAAQSIADRAKKGEPFDKLAKELSEDPSAKTNSGDLNFFSKEQMVPEFSEAAFSMKKDEISNPVRSQFGFHVIKVTDRKAAETITLEKAKPQLQAYLRQQRKQAEIEKIVHEIRDHADVKVNLPEPAAPTLAPEPPPAPAPEK